MSGRAIASPVRKTSWTPFRSMICQTRWGSNLGSRMVRWPAKRCISIAAWAPPCIKGLSGKVTIGSPSAAWRDWSYSSSRSPVMKSIPPPRTRQKSSWRHITPFGKPVVPPVYTM